MIFYITFTLSDMLSPWILKRVSATLQSGRYTLFLYRSRQNNNALDIYFYFRKVFFYLNYVYNFCLLRVNDKACYSRCIFNLAHGQRRMDLRKIPIILETTHSTGSKSKVQVQSGCSCQDILQTRYGIFNPLRDNLHHSTLKALNFL